MREGVGRQPPLPPARSNPTRLFLGSPMNRALRQRPSVHRLVSPASFLILGRGVPGQPPHHPGKNPGEPPHPPGGGVGRQPPSGSGPRTVCPPEGYRQEGAGRWAEGRGGLAVNPPRERKNHPSGKTQPIVFRIFPAPSEMRSTNRQPWQAHSRAPGPR
jgi:hypothetical protein